LLFATSRYYPNLQQAINVEMLLYP